MNWEPATLENFKKLIAKMSAVLRGMAEKRVSERAETIARADNRSEIMEKDMVDAFFAETPFGFQGLMKNDLGELGIDYTKYGHSR